ncbi:MAG: PIN domain-containing protein [Gammaproteobacteria bacterium]
MANFTAIYDACVLYPAPLRDFLLRLAMTELFRARWTDHIHGEWMRSVLNNRKDLTAGQLERTRQLMDQAVPDCLVTDYEDLIFSLELPDPDDRHVLAAAIRCQAGVIVTFNLDDFPNDTLERYGIEAQHPDEFIGHLLDVDPGAVCNAARQQRQALRNPPKSSMEFLTLYCDKGWQEQLLGLKR